MGGFRQSARLCRHSLVIAGALRLSVFWLMPGFRSARRATRSTGSRKTQHSSDRSAAYSRLLEQFRQAARVAERPAPQCSYVSMSTNSGAGPNSSPRAAAPASRSGRLLRGKLQRDSPHEFTVAIRCSGAAANV